MDISKVPPGASIRAQDSINLRLSSVCSILSTAQTKSNCPGK